MILLLLLIIWCLESYFYHLVVLMSVDVILLKLGNSDNFIVIYAEYKISFIKFVLFVSATEIQNIQIGEGNVPCGMAIPIYMIFPRLFTCPTLSTSNFKVGKWKWNECYWVAEYIEFTIYVCLVVSTLALYWRWLRSLLSNRRFLVLFPHFR